MTLSDAIDSFGAFLVGVMDQSSVPCAVLGAGPGFPVLAANTAFRRATRHDDASSPVGKHGECLAAHGFSADQIARDRHALHAAARGEQVRYTAGGAAGTQHWTGTVAICPIPSPSGRVEHLLWTAHESTGADARSAPGAPSTRQRDGEMFARAFDAHDDLLMLLDARPPYSVVAANEACRQRAVALAGGEDVQLAEDRERALHQLGFSKDQIASDATRLRSDLAPGGHTRSDWRPTQLADDLTLEVAHHPVSTSEESRALVLWSARRATARAPEHSSGVDESRAVLAERAVEDVVWDWRPQKGTYYISSRWHSILGHDVNAQSDTEVSVIDTIHPDDVQHVFEALRRHFQDDERFAVELRLRHSSGAFRWVLARGEAMRDEHGIPVRMVGTISDVTERKLAERALAEKEHQLRAIAETIDDAVWSADLEVAENFFISHAYERIWGRTRESLMNEPRSFLDAVHPADRARVLAVLERQRQGHGFDHHYRIIRPDGEVRDIRDRGFPVYDDHGRVVRFVGVAQDVTAEKLAAKRMEAALVEKDTLLREIHHRVKNNLQVILGLLHFQAGRTTNPESSATLLDFQQRILAMTVVHDHLYRSRDLGRVEMVGYVRELVGALLKTTPAHQDVRVDADDQEHHLPIDVAIPIGMALSELVTNALKHAFPKGRSGGVVVRIEAVGDDLAVEVRDDGVGLPADFDPETSRSFGWELVRLLALQVNGTLEVRNTDGVSVRIRLQPGRERP